MTCKPLIGMNADFRAAARNVPAYSYIAAGYFQSVIAAGGIPVVLPPMDDAESIHTAIENLTWFYHDRRSRLGLHATMALCCILRFARW
ncbi:gamma-glutamyl-gamma-aminobutyrate hydrolase family protein, partial [Novipirellula maiorica]|uniref:gamma-glutamyl-gamma-aminobutyrate hydrolase family protein n=1 Tax=Novipirellula maiorica TaxID=1265734 RepID=UPI001F19E581